MNSINKMENMFDQDFVGEVLLPLETEIGRFNKLKESDKSELNNHLNNNLKYEKLLQNSYQQFRSTLFLGEYLPMYICVKSENLKTLLPQIFIKVDFDKIGNETLNENEILMGGGREMDNAITFLDENHLKEIKNRGNNEQNFNNLYNSYNQSNEDLRVDKIIDRVVIEKDKSDIGIIELIKYITVPPHLVNKNILLKVNILKRNYFSPDVQLNNPSKDLLKIFESGSYMFNEEFTPIKTLFKEVKIIRPVTISSVSQFDLSSENSLIQIKFKNITNTESFIDYSLRTSKFINNKAKTEEKNNEMGLDLKLNDCQVLKEESTVESKSLVDIENLEEFNSNDIPFDSFEHMIVNKDFPYLLKPGEEFNLCIKMTKTVDSFENLKENFIREIKDTPDNIDTRYIPSIVSKTKVKLLSQDGKNIEINNFGNKSFVNTNPNKTTVNNINNTTVNIDNISRIDTESKLFFFDDKKSILTNLINEPQSYNHVYSSNTQNFTLSTLPKPSQIINNINSNIFQRQHTSKPKKSTLIANTYDSTLVSARENLRPNTELELDKQEAQNEVKLKSNIKSPSNKNIKECDSAKKQLDNIVKLLIRTPILISFNADKIYNSLFMNVPVSWKCEISKFIRVDLIIKSKPIIHENFTVQILIKNLTNKEIELDMLITTNKKCKNDLEKRDEREKDRSIPQMLSEFRYKKIGNVDPFNQRIVEINFMPINEGFNELPGISFIDKGNNIIFNSVSRHKIYVFN